MMTQLRLIMRKLREIIRLKFETKLRNRAIGRALKISASTVSYYVRASEKAGIGWPIPEGLDDVALWARIAPHCEQIKTTPRCFVIPDWNIVQLELKKKCANKQLLWEEYAETYGQQAYSYSQYCRHYKTWLKQQKITLRQVHHAGEKMFIDYAGERIAIYHKSTGRVDFEAYLFVAVLGASNYTYAQATISRALVHWIDAHVNAFRFFGGVTELLIPDNEKTAATKASYYEPLLNESYQEMAQHYSTVALPTRPRKPQDKAKVETAVKIAETWIIGRLREQRFHSIAALNDAIKPLLADYNQRPFQKKQGTRLSQFETIDKPALKALPPTPYIYAVWKEVMASSDYHVEIEKNYYSVPYQYRQKRIRCRLTAGVVESFVNHVRIASHLRSYECGKTITDPAHMPPAHRFHQFWECEKLYQWAETIGQAVSQFVAHVVQKHKHPEQSYRFHSGLLALAKRYGSQRLAQACQYAVNHRLLGYHHLESILKNNMDQLPLQQQGQAKKTTTKIEHHSNIRGADYYKTKENN